ncbi:hypothetical protein [Providencia rettgeri]|uniref:hypothetical protein n=2 Tax=Providencia rettgeri TaxID=587 RepID=UPI0018C7CFEA|nr:hypothetical protein [Providencia rettgeri]MBG5931025.1 hypothetical protein [Providencia rettgeri]HEM8125998.1 hypothetical protein [Providencia rettgeri]
MIEIRPNPHPLDFDWRFSDKTSQKLANICTEGRTLSLGVPTVAVKLEELKKEVTLIDSHPIQLVRNHICLDINFSEPLADSYEFVVMDPPWYLDIYYRWLSWAAISAGYNSKIYLSIWPDNTRPLAIAEKIELFSWISIWAEYEYLEGELDYETPIFEKMLQQSDQNIRKGDLAIITVKKLPDLKKIITANSNWRRYIINDYQLAVKVDENKNKNNFVKIEKLAQAKGWIWPSVSKRAAGRDNIKIWSSRNEVGEVDNPNLLIELLDTFIDDGNIANLFEKVMYLKEWKIPLPEYARKLKWKQEF